MRFLVVTENHLIVNTSFIIVEKSLAQVALELIFMFEFQRRQIFKFMKLNIEISQVVKS